VEEVQLQPDEEHCIAAHPGACCAALRCGLGFDAGWAARVLADVLY
jgi:hypothetical protein